MSSITVALDGPAGAGKSTIAKKIAYEKGLLYVDTGAMYRAITLKIINLKISINSDEQIVELLSNTTIDMNENDIFLDGIKVTDKIRTPIVTKNVSDIAKLPMVRAKMVELQRKIAVSKDVIMDGRDIGTNVLPNATYKFFLTASLDERAKRRYKEMTEKGYIITFDEIKDEIEVRDRSDSERDIDPLQIAEDAIIIDTTNKNIDMVLVEILSYIN